MNINKKIIIFTYAYPTGNSEDKFIEFELSRLSENFDKIEIIPVKNLGTTHKIFKKNINVNLELSKKLNIKNLIIFFFSRILFSLSFYNEIRRILFKKKFFIKLKMIILEITQSEIALDWILKYKNNYKNYVFYSFWSNFLLLTFKKLKEDKNIKTISRVLGSDLNGFIKDDDFVPFIDIKFITLDKIILLGDYQKDKLNKYNLDKKIEIVPLGVFQQNNNINNKIDLNEPLIFISCGNLIEIKNNLLMINFLEKFLKQTNKKVKYIMIGNGILKNKILNKIKVNSNIIFEYHEYVDNFVNFLKKNKVHFFLNFSSQEGMAFTIMESMSCGIPAITSDIPPNRYLVNTNGFLIDLKNYKDSINHVISNINQTIDNKEDYYLKSKRSFNFINENLINSKCYDKFELILKKI